MKKIIAYLRNIRKKLHVHSFDEAVASQYMSFNWRNVIYECRCGKRHMECVPAEWVVTKLPTAIFITHIEMMLILNHSPEMVLLNKEMQLWIRDKSTTLISAE